MVGSRNVKGGGVKVGWERVFWGMTRGPPFEASAEVRIN